MMGKVEPGPISGKVIARVFPFIEIIKPNVHPIAVVLVILIDQWTNHAIIVIAGRHFLEIGQDASKSGPNKSSQIRRSFQQKNKGPGP